MKTDLTALSEFKPPLKEGDVVFLDLKTSHRFQNITNEDRYQPLRVIKSGSFLRAVSFEGHRGYSQAVGQSYKKWYCREMLKTNLEDYL
jgi:hypothetical protein